MSETEVNDMSDICTISAYQVRIFQYLEVSTSRVRSSRRGVYCAILNVMKLTQGEVGDSLQTDRQSNGKINRIESLNNHLDLL